MKKIIINESQAHMLFNMLKEETYTEPSPQNPSMKKANKPYSINPERVNIVKRHLENNYQKGSYSTIGPNGMVQTIKIAGIIDKNSGNILKNIYLEDLQDLLVTQFQNMFVDKIERELFMKQVINDWFDDKIGPLGTLSVNHL